jgi:hypothetical protein
VQGRCSIRWSTIKATRRLWIDENKISVLLQYSLSKHADLPNVPLVMDLAKTDEQRAILKLIFGRQVMGRPFARRRDPSGPRAAPLRKAFMETTADKEFLAETEKAKLEITPVSGDKIESLVLEETVATQTSRFGDSSPLARLRTRLPEASTPGSDSG